MTSATASLPALQLGEVRFGTSGVRGPVSDLTDTVCAAYVHAFLGVMRERFAFGRVAVGIDLRPSSPRMAAACAAAIAHAGYEVDYLGELPTPALALHALEQGIPGVMVTGSHIPFDRNGLKFYRPDGEITKADEEAITEALAAQPWLVETRGLPAPTRDALRDYAARYHAFFGPGALAGMRVGVYEHSSVARDVLRLLLSELGAQVISLGRTDAFVPIDTEAVSPEDAERARAWSAEHGLDAIVSTDGDGDRPMIADERGEWLRGDIVGVLCARYLGVKALAVPVSCNTLIEKCGSFDSVVRTRIGSPYVLAAMAQMPASEGGLAGFEANGGFLLGSKATRDGRAIGALPTRDSALPILAVLAAAREAGKGVGALAADLPTRFTASDRLKDFPSSESAKLLERWAAEPAAMLRELGIEGVECVSVDRTDGLRVTLTSGDIVHLRASGNAPELRCYGEADDAARADPLVRSVLGRLAKMRHVM